MITTEHSIHRAVTTVTGNRRSARVLLERQEREHLSLGHTAWETPDVVPLTQWCDRLWWQWATREGSELTLLEPQQERVVWERVISQSLAAEDALGVDAKVTALARLAQEAWRQMHAWEVPLDALEASPNPDVAAFRRWAYRFREWCRRERWMDRARAIGEISDCLADSGADFGADSGASLSLPEQVRIRGVYAPTPQQRRLFAALVQAGVTLTTIESSRSADSVTRVAADDATAELHLAARWVRDVLDNDPGATPAVVVPGLEVRRDFVERVFDEVLCPHTLPPGADRSSRPFNLSFGRRLARVDVVHDALLVLRLCFQRVSLTAVGHGLRSPYLWSQEERFARARLDRHLRDTGQTGPGPGIIVDRLRALCGRFACRDLRERLGHLQTLARDASPRQSTSAWAQVFSGLLVAAGWPGPRLLDHEEYQAVSALNQLLREFAALSALTASTWSMRAGSAIDRLERLASDRVFQPKTDPVSVQVLGTLESIGLEFSHLWVCGLDDVNWPGASRPHPLLPIRLQRELHMPHADAEIELADCRRITNAWLSAAPIVVFSHAGTNGEESLRPSPLVAKFEPRPPDAATDGEARCAHTSSPYVDLIARTRPDLEALPDTHGPPVGVQSSIRGGATVFRDQAACAFRAFARHRLGASSAGIADSELDPRLRGTLVHRVLELVWTEIGSSDQLSALGRSGRSRVVVTAVDAALDAVAPGRPNLAGRLRRLEAARLLRLVVEWLELELERPAFVVQAPEKTRSVEVGGLPVALRPDRVDQLADRTYLLIDYKTSRSPVASWFGPRPEEPQLPLYTFALETLHAGSGRVSATTFAVVKRGDLAFVGLGEDDGIAPGVQSVASTGVRPARDIGSFEAVKREWGVHLIALAKAFRAGAAEVAPKSRDKTCRQCDLQALCRIVQARSRGEL